VRPAGQTLPAPAVSQQAWLAPGRGGCQEAKGTGARDSAGPLVRAELGEQEAQVGPDKVVSSSDGPKNSGQDFNTST
jgi:hypothetical protein